MPHLYITQVAVKQMLAQRRGGSVICMTSAICSPPPRGSKSFRSDDDETPMGEISKIQDIVDAVIYLTRARHVTGEVLHVDAGEHAGKW